MSKRTDAAIKRAIERAWDKPAAVPSETIANIYAEMTRFVRRAQAQAWGERYRAGNGRCVNSECRRFLTLSMIAAVKRARDMEYIPPSSRSRRSTDDSALPAASR